MVNSYTSFDAIYALVREIPSGQVASYGMVGSLVPGATARIAGYAMAAAPSGQNIPWQRVINAQGKISARDGGARQRKILEEEGIIFSKSGKVKWADFRWQGPSEAWLEVNGIEFIDFLEAQMKWPG